MTEPELIDQWNCDIADLAARLKMRRNAPLIVKRSRFHPLWLPAAFSKTPGAWGGVGHIIVSAEWLESDRETRRYIVAHELGHLARKHSERVLGSMIITVALGILIFATQDSETPLCSFSEDRHCDDPVCRRSLSALDAVWLQHRIRSRCRSHRSDQQASGDQRNLRNGTS
jgi:hypothetical protein